MIKTPVSIKEFGEMSLDIEDAEGTLLIEDIWRSPEVSEIVKRINLHDQLVAFYNQNQRRVCLDFLERAAKYAGTKFASDPTYLQHKARYEEAQALQEALKQ